MEKIFNIIPSAGEVFVCWFILQHLRGYKPFITTREFKGNLNKGTNELQQERKAQKRQEAEEWAEQERQKMRREPKF
jgi:hypothetical protein